MKAKFITGRAGSGKTSRVLSEIAENIIGGWRKPLLLLVPNQFSLEMEKNLVHRTNGMGMDIAQVLSFERLSYMVFSLYGRPDKKILEDTGKAALLRKILHDNSDSLKYYGVSYNREGFINLANELITELYKYGIGSERLAEIHKELPPNTLLSSKIGDLTVILKKFSSYIEDEYMVNEQNLDLLAEALSGAEYFHGCKVWLDGFFRFTGQDYAVIARLCEICEEFTLSLTMPETTTLSELSRIHDYDPFYETKATASNVLNILNSCGCSDISMERLRREDEYGYCQQLTHLERQYFNFSPKKYDGDESNITVNSAEDIYGEISAAVAGILKLVRENGYRYRDIAVCACDLEAYEHVLTDTFTKYEIPFFIDTTKTVYHKRIVEMMRSLIEIGASGWSTDSVIRLLRTGLLGFSRQETDILENYVIEYGISGYKWRLKEWKAGAANERYDLSEINKLRERAVSVTEPFLKLFTGKKKPTIKQACIALFDFIDANGVKERLASLEDNPKETAHIWGIVVSAFEKVVEVLADEKADIRLFSQIVESALSCASEGFIPQTSDMVILGDIKRTRLSEIKALFVIGLVDGALPSPKAADGLLTDADRLVLAEAGAEMAPFGVRKALNEQFLVYSAIAKPKERLYLSYPQMGFEGEEQRKSIVVDKITAVFPAAEKRKAADSAVYSKKALISELAVKAGGLKSGKTGLDCVWAGGLKWFYENDRASFELMISGAYSLKNNKRLSKQAAKSLIGKEVYTSVTRIEKYIRCPFSYFAEYGLRARERVIYGLKPVDLGNIYHYALDKLSSEMKKSGLKWGELADGKADSLIDGSVGEACSEFEILNETKKNQYLTERLKRITKRAVWALDYHVKNGSFTPFEFERGFGTGDNPLPPIIIELNEGYKFIFTGRIDRVDVLDLDGVRYVKIIDYKSGAQRFNLQEVYYGLQLQLMLYMDAYLKSGKDSAPAGVFYFRIADPIVSGRALEGEAVIDEILNELKLSGLTVNDSEIINALHNNLEGSSNIIPVKLNKPKKKDAQPMPSATSQVATMEQFYMLMKKAADVVREAGNRLIAGDIEPCPVKAAGKTPCAYCACLPICGFDINAGYRYRSIKKLKNSEVFELLEGKNDA